MVQSIAVTAQEKQKFYEYVHPIAKSIKALVPRLFLAVLMVQSAFETGYSTCGVSQCRESEGWQGTNNFSGIMPGGRIANYPTITDYVDAYARVIQTPAFGYPAVLAAGNVDEQFIALGASEWNGAGHYAINGAVGQQLIQVYQGDLAILDAILNPPDVVPSQPDLPGAKAASAPMTAQEAIDAVARVDEFLKSLL